MATTRGGASTRTSGDVVAAMGSPPISAQCVSWLATGPINQTFAPSKADARRAPDKEEEELGNEDRCAMIHLLVVAVGAAATLGAVVLVVGVGDHTRGKGAGRKARARVVRLSATLLMHGLAGINHFQFSVVPSPTVKVMQASRCHLVGPRGE